ncbi:probable protein phosphatase 2C 48 [Mangifera indica]|uniref:probable protein phosphatase 2C 48 n=1 Tax=Mangifera indica TaxID=29780 RepID=UPI001CFA137F|nr:probable protein phosphatase 2C 48 [Mangifera indica]
MVKPCWKSYFKNEDSGRVDGLLWFKDLGQYIYGEFPMAMMQANSVLEDQSQLESGPLSSRNSGPHEMLVRVYDGHGGPEAARFINDNLFCNLQSMLIIKFE